MAEEWGMKFYYSYVRRAGPCPFAQSVCATRGRRAGAWECLELAGEDESYVVGLFGGADPGVQG